MKFIKNLLVLLFFALLFISCSDEMGEEEEIVPNVEVSPMWVEGYPQIEPRLSSLEIKVGLDKKGKVFYVLTTGELEQKTSADIKTEALGKKAGNIVYNGVIEVTQNYKETIEEIKGLASNNNYNLYLVGGTDSLLMPDSSAIAIELYISPRQTAKPRGTTDAFLGYYEYLPEGYNANSPEQYPILIFLHGGKEIGNGQSNLNLVLKQGPTKVINNGKEFPFILLSPQTPSSWSPFFVNSFIEYAKNAYNVDEKRIYLTGLSMGAIGLYTYALEYPNVLAAIVPVAGRGDYHDACKIKDLPIWAFHNEDDIQISSTGTTLMINAIEECGGSPLMTLYPGTTHDAWTAAYAEDEMWEWLIKQAKK